MKKRVLSVLWILLMVSLVSLFLSTIYILYLNWPGELEEFTFIGNQERDINYSTSQQFYENMRFPDRIITYNFNSECSGEKIVNAEGAFSILEDKTILEFEKTTNNPQIVILCSDVAPEPSEEGYFVAGEGGPTEVINTTLYGAILSGKISLYREEECEIPIIAIHEILHVLGFEHNNNPNSVLYPELDCDQKIDDYIVEDLNNLYSFLGTADLKINRVDASKEGRYLSFDIEIINRGLADISFTELKVYSEGEFVKEFPLENVGIGVKKTLHVENLKISRFDEKISFVLDKTNLIPEIFEDNNEVELTLKEN
jgi:hypothetical protein